MNIKGGRWVVSLGKQIHGKQLDDMWLTLMLAVVWEQFENNNHVSYIEYHLSPLTFHV